MEASRSTAGLLRRVDLFSELSGDELSDLADLAVPRRYPAGARVFREGDRGDVCYVIRSGHARVTRQHHAGRQITLANVGPGDMFGELAMFDGEVRSATVEAIDELRAVALISTDLKRLLARHPEVAVKLLTAVVRRLRQANERILTQSFQTVAGRVSTALLQLSEEATHARSGGPVVVHATQTEVAQLAGTSRESVSRFLSSLQRAAVLKCGRGRIVIEDPALLARYIY